MKKLVVIVGVAMAAFSSQASYLWWTVDGDESGMSDVISYAEGLGATYDKLQVNVLQQYVDGESKTVETIGSATMIDEWYTGTQSIKLGDVSGSKYSYYIEIVNTSSGKLVGYGTTKFTYTALADELGAIVPDEMSAVPTAQIWHGGSYKAAPEPTSALLMLLGMAGLALRRKQRKLA